MGSTGFGRGKTASDHNGHNATKPSEVQNNPRITGGGTGCRCFVAARGSSPSFPACLNPAEPPLPQESQRPKLIYPSLSSKVMPGKSPPALTELRISQGGFKQRENTPTWLKIGDYGMSGHDILVPLSIEHHFQSRVKYQRLGGLCLTLWNYSTVACCFFGMTAQSSGPQ